jgi:hypothetical protein
VITVERAALRTCCAARSPNNAKFEIEVMTMAKTIKQALDETIARIAVDAGPGNRIGELPAPLTVPGHLRSTGTVSGVDAARAEQKRQDDALHGPPPAPRKP